MAYDFTKLTERQQELLTFEGWKPGQARPRQPTPAIVKKLIDRGLVVARPVRFAGVEVTHYIVPRDVHISWCEHCAEVAKL